jgi:hypothetical protein
MNNQKTAINWIDYYQNAFNHLTASSQAFCFGDDGGLITRQLCLNMIEYFKSFPGDKTFIKS